MHRRNRVGEDSTVVKDLVRGRTYYFRLATYDGDGELIGVSRPLMTIPGENGALQLSIPAPQVESPRYMSSLTWAPTSEALALIRRSDSGQGNVFVFDFAENRLTQATDFPTGDGRVLSVSWSPDGAWLAYCNTPSSTAMYIDYRIHVVSPDGSQHKPLSSGRVDCEADWLSREEVVFSKGTPGPPNIPELYRVSLTEPDSEIPITQDQTLRKYSPSVHPEDGTIVYSGSSVTGVMNQRLYLTNSSGGSGRQLIEQSYWEDIQPSWSADGQTVYFASNRSGHFEIWSIDVSTQQLNQVTRGLMRGIQRYSGIESPDGRTLALLEAQPNHEGQVLILSSPGQ